MNIYKKRRLYAIMTVLIIITLLVVLVRCCVTGNDNKTSKENDSDSKTTTSVLAYPDVSVSQSVTQITKSDGEKFSELDKIGLISAEFVPDDISLISPDYLNDIVVVGDSIAKGYSVYRRL